MQEDYSDEWVLYIIDNFDDLINLDEYIRDIILFASIEVIKYVIDKYEIDTILDMYDDFDEIIYDIYRSSSPCDNENIQKKFKFLSKYLVLPANLETFRPSIINFDREVSIDNVNETNAINIIKDQFKWNFKYDIIKKCLDFIPLDTVQDIFNDSIIKLSDRSIGLKDENWESWDREHRAYRFKTFTKLSKIMSLFKKRGIICKIDNYITYRIDNYPPEFRDVQSTYPNFVSSRDYFFWESSRDN